MCSSRKNQEAKVEIINDSKEKVELEYPCNWCYKVIGESSEGIEEAVKDVIDEREHKLSESNKSKGGKYTSMNLDMLVHNDDDRQAIYEELKKHKNVKMVI